MAPQPSAVFDRIHFLAVRGQHPGATGATATGRWRVLHRQLQPCAVSQAPSGATCGDFLVFKEILQKAQDSFLSFSRMRSEGFSFNSGGLGVEPCSRPVVSTSATVRNRPQPSAVER